MAIETKDLYTGYLAAAAGDILAPVGVKHYVRTIDLNNTNATDEVWELLWYKSAVDYQLQTDTLLAGKRVQLEWGGGGKVLETGMKLRGNTTTASKVVITISGAEES